MAAVASLVGLGGLALVCARAGFAFGSSRHRWLFAAAAFVVALVPLGSLPLAGFVRGLTGDLSMSSLVLVGAGFVYPRSRRRVEERSATAFLVLAGAVGLYPMALGLGPYDPYRLGFDPGALLVASFAIACVAWYRAHYVLLLCVLVAVGAHYARLMESQNLWDYLLDPWLCAYAIYEIRALRRNT